MEHDEEAFGAMLALLVAGSDFTDEQKEAWATVIPYMEIESMEKLATFLAMKMNAKLEAELSGAKEEIEAILKKSAQEQQKIDEAFSSGLAILEKELV
jgi:hypothetical protein